MKLSTHVLFSLGAVAVLMFPACVESHSGPSAHDKNTNWLLACTSDQQCDGDLDCVCGVCTVPCARSAECGEYGEAAICAEVDHDECAEIGGRTSIAALCTVACETDDQCNAFGPALLCAARACVPRGAVAADAGGAVSQLDTSAAGAEAGATAPAVRDGGMLPPIEAPAPSTLSATEDTTTDEDDQPTAGEPVDGGVDASDGTPPVSAADGGVANGPLTFAFTASVIQVDDTTGNSGVQNGDVITGAFTFDPAVPDGRGAATFASYYFDNAPGEFELSANVGNLAITTAELDTVNFSSSIDVKDGDPPAPTPRDAYAVFTREATAAGFGGWRIVVTVELVAFADLAVFTSTALPTTPPDITRFEERFVTLSLEDSGSLDHIDVLATLTALTVAP